MSQELSFDGCGINGPDEYRTRLATFATPRGDDAIKYGPMFAASPDMLAALVTIADRLEAWAETSERIASGDTGETDSMELARHRNISSNFRDLIRTARDSMPK